MSAENKTKPTKTSVKSFIGSIADPVRREDCRKLSDLMQKITGEPPVMWGPSIVGFGEYHYKYKSGREGNWFLTGFSPRKQALTIYVHPCSTGSEQMRNGLGKFKSGVSCLYVKRLEDINMKQLENLIRFSISEANDMNRDQ